MEYPSGLLNEQGVERTCGPKKHGNTGNLYVIKNKFMLVVSKCAHTYTRRQDPSPKTMRWQANKLARATAKIEMVKGKWIVKSRRDTKLKFTRQQRGQTATNEWPVLEGEMVQLRRTCGHTGTHALFQWFKNRN